VALLVGIGLGIFLAAAIGVASAQGPTAALQGAAPRIGLVLSGGGARGLAHVGVLKVLEDLRVPVSCITGTSMGAIVGGAYASGMTAAALEEKARSADWDDLLRDRPPRAELSSRRKFEDYKTLFAIEYGVKAGGLALPKGVLAGVAMEGFIRELTQQAIGTTDFRRLPIPFLPVAADIETGEAVVLERGSLAQAIRASMSLPGLIAPVEVDGRLLVDGGIANNLPVDEARKLCADVLIAVNIGTPPLEREQIQSVLSVTNQLSLLLGQANVEAQLRSLGERDVLIAPELADISVGSFRRAGEAIRRGEAAARAASGTLQRYSLPAEQYAALRRRQVVAAGGLGSVDEIRFEGLQRTNPEVLRALVRSKPGEPLAEAQVSADLRRIYGRDDFESVGYRIEEDAGRRVMVIRPREKEWGPDYLRFGLGLATDFQGGSFFNILASYRRTWLNRLGAEWLWEAQIGRDTYLLTELYQPVEPRGRFFVAPYAGIGRSDRGVFVGEDRVADYDVDYTRVGLDTGAALGTWGEARLGALWRRVDARIGTGAPVLPALDERSAGPRALLFADRYDSAWFPRRGYRALATAYVADESFGSDREYKRVEAQISGAKSWDAHTLNVTAWAGGNLDTDLPAYEAFTLGGPLRLSGYRIDEFAGRRMSFARVMYYNRTIALPGVLGTGVFLGGSLEAGQMKQRFDGFASSGTVWSGSGFLAADSFLGPGFLGVGAGEGGRWSLFLLLGAP
jgi:NTE family protein